MGFFFGYGVIILWVVNIGFMLLVRFLFDFRFVISELLGGG